MGLAEGQRSAAGGVPVTSHRFHGRPNKKEWPSPAAGEGPKDGLIGNGQIWPRSLA